MKLILIALALITPAFAVQFDSQGFGASLNGWKKDRVADYSFTDASYRTYMPTTTETPGGGLYLSTQVDLLAFGARGAISHIDMTFSPSGTLLSAPLRTTVKGKTVDTGLVRRPTAPPAVEAEPAVSFDATGELIVELFNRFDAEMKQITESKEFEKRDLFSRFSKKDAGSANLADALRHNVNLMLQFVSA